MTQPCVGEPLWLELVIGDQRIEVRLDEAGILFRQPGSAMAQGLLPWDVAIAQSLLPEARRRAAAA
ncbi:MAG: hypothetical protein ACE5IL_04570 [Myxococcota bacterium]